MLTKGTRVILSRVRHAEFIGLTGTIRRYIKCRNEYDIKLDNGKLYGAFAENVDALEGDSCAQ